MGKRIIQQRRGKGSPTYRVPSRKFSPSPVYSEHDGVIRDMVRSPLIDAPLARVEYADRNSSYIIAAEGMKVGDSVKAFIMPLSMISEGTRIFGIETSPNSGPKMCRSPGTFATLVFKGPREAVVQLPSRKKKSFHLSCRATLGIPAGEGRAEKPMVKAGNKWHAMHVRGKLYPRTSGNKMNIVDHPFGGSGHGKVRRPVSRHAPPGRKVGTVSPRRTGKKK